MSNQGSWNGGGNQGPGAPPPGWNAAYPGAPPPDGPPPGEAPFPPMPGNKPAWEDRTQGFFARWWGTVKAVTFSPREHFALAAQSDDVWPPIWFAVINGALVGLVLGAFIAVLYIAMGGIGALSAGARSGGGPAAAMFGMMAAMGIGVALIYPIELAIAGFIGPWVNGGIHHLVLMMLGGAKAPYTKTVRVTAYAMTAQFWFLVPCIGPLAAIAVHFIANAVGLDETHKCGLGKAVAALLLVPAICVCLYIGLFALGFASGLAQHH